MRFKYDFETMNLEDHFVAIPVGDGATQLHGVIKMNESAMKIFQMIGKGIDEAEIITNLLEEYKDSPREQVQEYVHSLIQLFLEKDILEII